MVVVGFEENGTKGWRKGQSVQSGEADGYCHSDAELAIESSTGAAHKRNGDEHRHHDEGDGNNGTTQFAHGIKRSGARGGISQIEFGVYAFHHDNGVIDNNGDGEDEG